MMSNRLFRPSASSDSHTASMTSRQIAELTSKRHDNVCRDIVRLLKTPGHEYGISETSFEMAQGFGGTRMLKMYVLTRPAVMRLLCKYSEEAMAAVLSRVDATMLEELISEFDAEDLQPDQYIYVAVEKQSGRYKIGISKHPLTRVKQLSSMHPEGLRLVSAYRAVNGRLSEQAAHKELGEYRLNGEWFSKEAPVGALISRAKKHDTSPYR